MFSVTFNSLLCSWIKKSFMNDFSCTEQVEGNDTHYDAFFTVLEEIPVLKNIADELKQAVQSSMSTKSTQV